ncbi:MAG: hypothetical protein IBV52_06625 [Candidatus Bathyarchaeota archaeon]
MPVLLNRQKQEFQKFEKNMKWFHKNYDRLRGQYAGEYVAVNEERVVMHNRDAETMIRQLQERFGDVGAFVIEFVTNGKFDLIL